MELMNYVKNFLCTTFIFYLMLGCMSQEEYIITNKQVGKYRLGDKLESSFDKKVFLDITVDSEKNIIESIVVSSNLYKTNSGFSVGSSMSDILTTGDKLTITESKLSKSGTVIGSLGNIINKEGIAFVDSDMDGIVDLVWIDKKFNLE